MTIKEAEKLTGVSSRNIRFYEQKGLLTPGRNRENDYREYSDGDIERLKLIRALRMVDMPLEQIKRIVDGELSLQLAVAQQKRELRSKIKQIETAVHFCDELEKVDELGIGEVLAHMDEPENRKMLSKKWKMDFVEVVKKVGIPIYMGIVLFGLNILLNGSRLLLSLLPQGYTLSLAFGLIILWGYVGYRMYEKTWWWVKALLAHAVTSACFITVAVAQSQESQYTIPSKMCFATYFALKDVFVGESSLTQKEYVIAYLVTLTVFFVGMLLGKIFQSRKRQENGKSSVITEFLDSHERIKVAVWILLIVLVIALPASVDYAGPEDSERPQLVTSYLIGNTLEARIGREVLDFKMGNDFAEIIAPDEWERKYVWLGLARESVAIDVGISDRPMITIYRNDVVRVFTGGGFLQATRSVYYKLPDGTAKKVVEYIQANRVEDITE